MKETEMNETRKEKEIKRQEMREGSKRNEWRKKSNKLQKKKKIIAREINIIQWEKKVKPMNENKIKKVIDSRIKNDEVRQVKGWGELHKRQRMI